MVSIVPVFNQIKPALISRILERMSSNTDVRNSFSRQIARFFDAFVDALDNGDPGRLDPIIDEWVQARTQSELVGEHGGVLSVFNSLLVLTFEEARSSLSKEAALDLLQAVLPVFVYLSEQVSFRETEAYGERMSAELRKTTAALEKLDVSKSGFISVAAHELRTPLTLIEGYAHMIKEAFVQGYQADQVSAYLEGLDTGAHRLREIIDDMLDVSLIDNNLLSISFQPVWFDRLFSILERELQVHLKERRLDLVLTPFPGWDQMTYGDGERLVQAFRNILQNAIKYTPDGGRIAVGGRKLPGFLEVTVADTGIGIDLEDQQVIFEKFGQLGSPALHSSSKTQFKGGGPGLGLPIAKGIIEAHGGTVWVESPGFDEVRCPGATFHVLVPLVDEPPPDKTGKLFNRFHDMNSIYKFRKLQDKG